MNDSSCLQRQNFSRGTAWPQCATLSKQAAALATTACIWTRGAEAPFHRSGTADGAVPPGGGGGRGGSESLQQLCSVSEAAGVEFRSEVRRYCPVYRPSSGSRTAAKSAGRNGTTRARLQAGRGLCSCTWIAAAVSGSQKASFIGPARQAASDRRLHLN